MHGWTRTARITLFALVWFSAAWFGSWQWNPNNSVRLFAAISIVEDGDATIDRFQHLTIDKARFGPHFYLDKPPGMTLMAVPVVAIADAVTHDEATGKTLAYEDRAFDDYMKLRLWLAAALINATLLACAAVALMDVGARLTRSNAAGVFAALAFALGTPVWGWSTTLFGHATVASLLLIAIRFVLKGSDLDRGRFDAGAAGLALGWALVVEHSALLFAVPIGIWALWRMQSLPSRERPRAAIDAIIGGAAAMLPLLAYNLFALGDPFRLGYEGVVGWDGMKQGLFGLTFPHLGVLGEILIGSRRGMFWVAPVLAVAPIGIVIAWRRGARDIALLALSGAMIAFLYNAAYVYWDGGNSTGPRHATPAIAFLSLALPWLWAASGRFVRIALALLLGASVAINLAIASAEITAPADLPNGLIDGVLQGRFLPGYLRTIANEWFGWSPWAGLAIWAGVAATLFAATCIALTRQRKIPNI